MLCAEFMRFTVIRAAARSSMRCDVCCARAQRRCTDAALLTVLYATRFTVMR
jgi:hypothetical protein